MKKNILCLILKLFKIKIKSVMPKKALIVFDLSPVKMIDTKKIKINKKIKIFDSLLFFNFYNK